MSDPEVRGIEARVHGRYLVRAAAGEAPWPMLVGFHGYGEDAVMHLAELTRIPGAAEWLVVSVQALHPFYTRDDRIVASWMTRQDRELAIADNIDYVGRVLEEVRRRYQVRPPLVFAGFSQGGAMAYRAAGQYQADAVIVLGADVPPDVTRATPIPLPPVLIGRGARDTAYVEATQASDVATLQQLGIEVQVCNFDGGHEWSDTFRDAAGALLARLRSGL